MMKRMILTLTMVAVVVGAAGFARADERSGNPPTTTTLASAGNTAVAQPVRSYHSYWGGYVPHYHGRYYTYHPHAYWHGPRYYYYPRPYRDRYYYPDGFNFYWSGPRRSFGFGF